MALHKSSGGCVYGKCIDSNEIYECQSKATEDEISDVNKGVYTVILNI